MDIDAMHKIPSSGQTKLKLNCLARTAKFVALGTGCENAKQCCTLQPHISTAQLSLEGTRLLIGFFPQIPISIILLVYLEVLS